MNEEVKLKVSMPMFQDGELERFDSNIHSIIEEYSKMQLHEKDQILTQRIIMKQEEEIERLKELSKVDSQQAQEIIIELKQEIERLNNIIKEAIEYITSYESISTIQGLEDIEANKDLDEKTLNEMVRRYMIVHDKLLEILDKENKND